MRPKINFGVGPILVFHQSPTSFFVDEHLAYQPSGSGGHAFVRFRKKDMSTFALKRRISEILGVPLKEIRHAGKKDAAATATQWISWPIKEQKSEQPLSNSDHYEVLEITKHEHSLSVGHVKSNSFRLLLDGPEDALNDVSEKKCVFPNFFGPQRFGSGNRVWSAALSPSGGPRPSRDAVSVRQAVLFNTYLHHWFARGGFSLGSDEIWMNAGSKRFFQAPLDDDLRQRFEQGTVSPSGPIFGYKTQLRPAEEAFLQAHNMTQEDFRKWGKSAKGSRRALFASATEFQCEFSDKRWSVSFQLPAGVYATVFLLHLMSPQVLTDPPQLMPNFTQQVVWEKDAHGYRLAVV